MRYQLAERLIARTKIGDGTECWEWTGAVANGYGRIVVPDTVCPYRVMLVHRLSYLLFNGPLDAQLQIDHLCRNRRCIRPDHLEQVTGKVNCGRGLKATQTFCIHGHEYTPENAYIRKNGTRHCWICYNERSRKWNPVYYARWCQAKMQATK